MTFDIDFLLELDKIIQKEISEMNDMPEPTLDQMKKTEEFEYVAIQKWDSFKCRSCGKYFSIMDRNVHSDIDGDLRCPKCGSNRISG